MSSGDDLDRQSDNKRVDAREPRGSDQAGRGRHAPRGSEATLDVWVLEPYFGGSHRSFLEGLSRHSRHAFTLLGLPGRHWKWRMHGGALSLAQRAGELRDGRGAAPHVFFASDMLDVPVFQAAVAPVMGRAPMMVYFHENQLTYPLPPGVERDLGYGFKNLAGATVADKVLFNSAFHRREFLAAAESLLEAMPDEVPSWALEAIEAKSSVLPVGCDLRRFERYRARALADSNAGRWGDPAVGPLILWNQRWEYDKAPADLFAALYELKTAGVPFRLAMAGPNQGTPTAAFLRARDELAAHVVQWGKVTAASDYAALLWSADVVVSTAIHEFFGIAVVEAMYCGCRPLLPHRLSYPELVPEEVHAEVLYAAGDLPSALARALAQPRAWSEDWQRTWVARFDWGTLRTRYDEEIRQCWESATHFRDRRGPAW